MAPGPAPNLINSSPLPTQFTTTSLEAADASTEMSDGEIMNPTPVPAVSSARAVETVGRSLTGPSVLSTVDNFVYDVYDDFLPMLNVIHQDGGNTTNDNAAYVDDNGPINFPVVSRHIHEAMEDIYRHI